MSQVGRQKCESRGARPPNGSLPGLRAPTTGDFLGYEIPCDLTCPVAMSVVTPRKQAQSRSMDQLVAKHGQIVLNLGGVQDGVRRLYLSYGVL